jgi:hypothetical protein
MNKNLKNEIRRVVNGRAEIRPIREAKKLKPGFYWVEMYVTNLIGHKKYGAMRQQIVNDLNAVGIPAETGHYGNEISFFVTMNQMTAAHDASYAAQESRINAIERATWQDEQGEI